MNTVNRAPRFLTEDERKFMRVPPYLVHGTCGTCKSRGVIVRVYGIKADLENATLVCVECQKR